MPRQEVDMAERKYLEEMEEEEELSEAELEAFKSLLTQKRQEILDRNKARGKNAAFNASQEPGDAGDVASDHSNQLLQTRLAERDSKLLREINNALSKFESGTYGYCEGTDELIGRARLKVRPWTRYSVAYKEGVEQARKEQRITANKAQNKNYYMER